MKYFHFSHKNAATEQKKSKTGKPIIDLSKVQTEDEVLFSSKTKFLVEDIIKSEDGLGGWIVNMVISEL